MQTPTSSRPVRREEDLIVIPEAREPRPRGLIAAVIAGALVALMIGGVIGYAVQASQVNDLEAQLDDATASQETAAIDVAAALERIQDLQVEVATLGSQADEQQARIDELRQNLQVVRAGKQESRNALASARADLAASQARVRSLTGPPLPNGTSIGRVIAVGATQAPPRLVFDGAQWFTGAAADRAAIQDGVIGPLQSLRHARYFRNTDPAWRTMPLDANATVTLWRFHPRFGTITVSISEFQRISRLSSPWAQRVMGDPFWITVAGGEVTSLRQQQYP